MNMKIAVIGSGGWGTALACMLLENGHEVSLWSYTQAESDGLKQNHKNPFLPGIDLPDGLEFTSDPAVVQGKGLVVMATPSFAIRSTSRAIAPHLEPGCVVVSVTKGIEAGTGKRMSQIIAEETGATVAALSGPSHAEEVSRGIPTGVVVAAEELQTAELVQDAFMNDRFRVYTSADMVGVELGAALKNVIALCAGVCDGLGLGDNSKALLITRGLSEITRLGLALGGKKETFLGLAGVGDLIVTCTSMHSRNCRAGILIGKGKSVKDAMDEVGAVVEGYYATESAMQLAQKTGVEMPIVEQAYAVLYEGRNVNVVLEMLMSRARRVEYDGKTNWN